MTDDSMEDFFNLNALDTNTTTGSSKKQKLSTTPSKKTATKLVETEDTDDILALFGNEFDSVDNENKATNKPNTTTNHDVLDNPLEEDINNLFGLDDEVIVEPSNNLSLPPIIKPVKQFMT